MATSRFPLVVNTATSRIAELPAGDDLDLSGSDISNVGNITVSGTMFGTASNAATAATVTTAAQPNITSTGTLTSLNVSGTITGGNITISTGVSNLANLVTIKYNETVIAGGSTGDATITPNAASGTIFNYTVTGDIVLSALSNAVAGTGVTIILTQGGSGSYTLTSTMKFLGGAKTLSTDVGAIDIMSVFYDGTTYYASLGKGFA